jgi:hypothetical protein
MFRVEVCKLRKFLASIGRLKERWSQRSPLFLSVLILAPHKVRRRKLFRTVKSQR